METIRQVDWGGLNLEYRYTLWVIWDDLGKLVQFIGLNPSTADEINNDPTLRRCIGFAQKWGFGGLCMTNLFAWRDTKPENMKRTHEPIGEKNDFFLRSVAEIADLRVAGWGNDGAFRNRGDAVRQMIPDLMALRINKASGQPMHPLYAPSDIELVRYS